MNSVGSNIRSLKYQKFKSSEAEFKEFEPRLKSAKNRFQSCASLNLEKFNTILGGTNHI